MSKVICPNCGSEVVLPKTSEVILGKTISEEGNNTYMLNMKKKENETMNSAEVRKTTLEQNGISTDKYFSLQLPSGKTVYIDENGDKVDISIVGGNIGNKKLHRRWVMAQWFRQYNDKRGYSEMVYHLVYDYQWKMISNELKALAKLEKEDKEYFEERTHFFNIYSITQILNQYVQDLHNKVNHMKTKNCKGVPYYHIAGKNIFVSDMEKKLFSPLASAIFKFSNSINYTTASINFERIKKEYLKVYKPDAKYVGQTFKDCYKGAGAYYTLQNMVLYHNCFLYEYKLVGYHWEKGTKYVGIDAYNYMKSKLDEYQGDGWRWVGVLKRCIKDNNFSFKK